jgi:hypothetical protein
MKLIALALVFLSLAGCATSRTGIIVGSCRDDGWADADGYHGQCSEEKDRR